eukprot:TRINITY_DN5525_c0_g1_i1.p1 TRINITY_DN5525_c0_g1~~TRINITY_DN5525_c0_g1_i1.p1  ORF type:complete len:494 (-),score=138.91 TRINITY_DN5525_c0_g1_i1:193-1650(-)
MSSTSSSSSSSTKTIVSEYRFRVKCDEPVKEATLKCSSSLTFAELVTYVAKTLSMKEDEVKRYAFSNVSMGHDIVELGKSPKELLSEVGCRTNSVVFIRAPPDIKPPKKFKKKKIKEVKEEEVAPSTDKYKGLTIKNIFKKLEDYKDKPKKLKLAHEYIEIYFSKFVKENKWVKLPKWQIAEYVQSDRINIKEADLFEAVMEWCKNRVKEMKAGTIFTDDKKPSGTEEKKETKTTTTTTTTETPTVKGVAAAFLPFIRFPVMTTTDIATKVQKEGLLEADQILQLFTYIGMKDTNKSKPAKLGNKITSMNAKERKGRKPPSWFKWDSAKKHYSLMVSSDGMICTSTTTSYYQPVFGDSVLTEGVWEWEIVLTQFYSNSYSVCIGVSPSTYTGYSSSYMIGYSGHAPGWAYAVGYGYKFDNGSQTSYGRTCYTGDVIKCRLDMDKHTLEFFVNGTSQGVAFRNIGSSVRPSMSMYGSNVATLRFPH